MLILLAGFIFGFVIYGATRVYEIRAAHAEDRRVSRNVLMVSWRISQYFHIVGRLPRGLNDIRSKFGSLPKEQAQGEGIIYRPLEFDRFRLCAMFHMKSPEFSNNGSVVKYGDPVTHGYGKWIHGAGLQCIDKTLKIFAVPSYKEWMKHKGHTNAQHSADS